MERYYHDQIKGYQTEIVPISNMGRAASLRCTAKHIWPMQIQNGCMKITTKVRPRITIENMIHE